jgi:Raf kinase inhibitor-like YbhB/YbcL family protein
MPAGWPAANQNTTIRPGENHMRSNVSRLHFVGRACLTASVLALVLFGGASAQDWGEFGEFSLSSATFKDGSTLPLSMIDEIASNGVNQCSLNGAAGGDMSPELHWSRSRHGTQTFAVVAFDVTASFTHWGIYNIPGNALGLPQNAGAASETKFGTQILNDFGLVGYDGPCPPANYPPDVHRYIFTVYALDRSLDLPDTANFPADAETLLNALARLGAEGHVLASASITGFYSTTPTSP